MNLWIVSFDFVQIPANVNAKNADANNANANNAPSSFVGGARARSMLLAALIIIRARALHSAKPNCNHCFFFFFPILKSVFEVLNVLKNSQNFARTSQVVKNVIF